MIAERLHIALILKSRLAKTPPSTSIIRAGSRTTSSISTATSSAAAFGAAHDRATLERIVGWMHAKLLNRPVRCGSSTSSRAWPTTRSVSIPRSRTTPAIDGGARRGAHLPSIYDTEACAAEDLSAGAAAVQSLSARACDIAADFIDSYQQIWRQPFDMSAGISSRWTCRAPEKAISARSCSTMR